MKSLRWYSSECQAVMFLVLLSTRCVTLPAPPWLHPARITTPIDVFICPLPPPKATLASYSAMPCFHPLREPPHRAAAILVSSLPSIPPSCIYLSPLLYSCTLSRPCFFQIRADDVAPEGIPHSIPPKLSASTTHFHTLDNR